LISVLEFASIANDEILRLDLISKGRWYDMVWLQSFIRTSAWISFLYRAETTWTCGHAS